MKLLRRLLGGDAPAPEDPAPDVAPAEIEETERRHEVEALRAEQAKLDEFRQRQQRFQQYAWTPPAQGGSRRADDEGDPAAKPD